MANQRPQNNKPDAFGAGSPASVKVSRTSISPARRLTVVMIADIVGYTTMMNADEDRTHLKQSAVMTRVIKPLISRLCGKIVKSTGDGFLAEFASAADAVQCAIRFQKRLAALAASVPGQDQLLFRVAVHLADVITEPEDIYGNGVNIAARLQTLAKPGGIIISGAVRDNLQRGLASRFDDLGEQHVKGIKSPLRVFSLSSAGPDAPEPDWNPDLSRPNKPSIAVLPFRNLSGDPNQEYFADGMVSDIIAALSQIRSLFVISRNSSFCFRDRPSDVKQVAWQLGVQYVLDGTVRRSNGRIRVTGDLVDAATGIQLWAGRFEGGLDDVFALQDQVTASVVAAIEPQLLFAEVERVRRHPPDNLQAHDLFLRATGHFYAMTREDIEASLALATRSIQLDPGYARSYALAGRCYFHRKVRGWVSPTDSSIDEGVRLARIAADLGGDNSEVLWMAAIAIGLAGGCVEEAVALIDRSLALNPNSSEALTYSGMLRAYIGQSDLALEHLGQSARLSPLDVQTYNKHTAAAFAHFAAGRLLDAVIASENALSHKMDYQPPLRMRAACLGLLGRAAEGRQAVARLLSSSPGETLQTVRAYYERALKVPGCCDRLIDGLRQSGLPAGP